MTPYASATTVPVSRTRAEIEELLLDHKATTIGIVFEEGTASVAFKITGWAVRFKLTIPKQDEERFTKKAVRGWRSGTEPRNAAAAKALWEQACRSAWRALYLTIKAKLVSVEAGVETFEEAFLAHVVDPDTGGTVGDQVLTRLRFMHSNQLQLQSGVTINGSSEPQ